MRPRLLLPLIVAGLVLAGCSTAEPPPLGVVQPPVPTVTADPAIAALAPSTITASGALRVAVPAGSGAERELAAALAAKLGLALVADGVSATVLPQALFESRHDVGISPNPTTAPAGAEQIPWIAARTTIVTPPGNPDRVEPTTLCGHRIGVVAGSAQHADVRQRDLHCVDNRLRPIEVVPVSGAADAARRIRDGSLNAFVADTPAAGHTMVLGEGRLALPTTAWGEGEGVITAPAALVPALSAALDALRADGTYDTILQRWLLTDPR